MPGNEVGDRVHNFFGQENLSQGQYNSQAVDGNWPGLSNNLWASSQRPAGAPFISNLKNFNVQQSDSEQGHASSPRLQHGLNLPQSNLKLESSRNQPHNQQATVNGYMQGHQVFQTRQNEANILGVDTESDRQNSTSRGISVLESQGSGLELYRKNFTNTAESPVNFDFFGGQQQISGRHPSMLQSIPRQPSGANDMQLLQQQVMLSQMQELQRQQQFHQLEARQRSAITPASSISKQAVGNHFNGIPINEASNLTWQPEVMATNANWLQRGASPIMQGSSNGLLLSPEQGQTLRLMGLVPNQGDQSFYGIPISSSRGTPNLYSHIQVDKPAISQMSIPHQFSHVEGDKPTLPHISAGGNSFPAHQYAAYSDGTNTNDGTSVSRQDIQGKFVFGSTIQGINSGLIMGNSQQMNSEQRNVPMQDFRGRQELAGSSEMSQDKMVVQVPSPSQNVATLDPTEEKILFGSDDSPWGAFGRNTGVFNILDDTDSFNGFSSLQSGSWSALMQSAVAETSSSDIGIQEECSNLNFRNTECLPGNERLSTIDSSKQQSVWAENNLQSSSNASSRPGHWPDDVNRPNVSANYSGCPGFNPSGLDFLHDHPQDRLRTDSSQRSLPQSLEKGKQQPFAERSHIHGNATKSSSLEINDKGISGSWTHQQTLSCNSSGKSFNRSNGWNLIKPVPPGSTASLKTHENEKSLHPHHEKDMHEESGQVPGPLEPDSDGLEHIKSADNMHVHGEDSGMNGISALPNSATTWVNRQSNQQLPNSLNVDVWRDADSSGSYRGNEGPGKYRHRMEKNPLVLESSMNDKIEGEAHDMENSKNNKSAESPGSNSAHHRSGARRGNVCFDDSDLRSPKSSNQVNRRPPPLSRKFQYHPMGDPGVDVEPSYGKKHVINSQPMSQHPFGGLKGQDQSYLGLSKFRHTDGDYAEMEKGDSKSLVDNASKSLLPGHIQKSLTSFDRSVGNYAPNKTASPRVTDTEASDGSLAHPQWNQSSSSQGFGLQLAPPTQRLPMVSSHGLSETIHTTSHVASETRDKDHTWLAGTQTLPSQESSHGELRNSISGVSGQIFDKGSPYNMLGNIPQALTSGFPFSRIHTQNQNIANIGSKVENTHDMENTNKTDNSAVGLGSNSAHHRAGGMRENVCFDGSGLRSPKLSNQVNQRPPVSGQFQYHQVGVLGVEVEPSYEIKHINSQPMPQQPFEGLKGRDQSYLGHSKLGPTDGDFTEMEGNAPAFQGHSKSLVDNSLKSLLPDHRQKKLTSFDRSVGNYTLNKTASPRVSDTESSDGSVVHPQRNQRSSSQGFGLQLAPPTQRLPMVSSHGLSEAVLNTSHVASETGDKNHTWLANTQTFPSQESSHGELRNNISGTSGQVFYKASPYIVPGNIPQAFTSGFPFSRIHTQNQNMANLGRQVVNAPCANVTYDRTASMNQIEEYCERPQTNQSELASAQEMSELSGTDQIQPEDPAMKILTSEAGKASQPCVTFGGSQHGAPSKVLHNVWTSVSSKQHPNLLNIPSHSLPINNCEMTTGPQKTGDKDSEKDENDLSDVGPCSVYSNSSGGKEQLLNESSGQQILPESADAAEEAVSASHGKESVLKSSPDASHSSSAATSRDIEAFGRSLRPNNILHQSLSLLYQYQSMKNTEFDPSNRDVKRLKVSDNAVDEQQVAANRGQQLSYGCNAIVKDVLGNHPSAPPSDSMLSFLTKSGDGQDTNASSPEALEYGQKNSLHDSNSNKATSVRSEHSLISPQMAPSWFEQYGTFKNGNTLPMYNVRNMTPPKIMDHPFIIPNQFESLHVRNSVDQVNSLSDTGQLGNTQRSPVLASVAIEHVPHQLLPPAVEPDLVMRQKKRKSAASELVPWHRELTQGSERLQNISAAEFDWAQAANRLIEKVEEDTEVIEDIPPMVKSKRRLVLTTQLMQQLLNPPPAAVLSADVKLHHESVVYSVARLALGDACSSVSWSGRDALMPPGSRNLLSERLKSSKKIDQYILKVMEDLVGRARKLENDILRLDSRASILDLRLECQDLERFSVINRFAKFHGRGQNDVAETSSSDAAANAQKIFPQKYVTAVPMPKSLPDRVQCLSL